MNWEGYEVEGQMDISEFLDDKGVSMTENEAKQVLDNIWDFVTPEDDCLGDFVENALYVVDSIFEEIQQYRAIGTVEEFKALKEKNTPMKHHHTRIDNISDEIRVSVCPNCLSIMYTHSEEYPVFCNVCGQKLDWQ